MNISKVVFSTEDKLEIVIEKDSIGNFEVIVYDVRLGYRNMIQTVILTSYKTAYLYVSNTYLSEKSVEKRKRERLKRKEEKKIGLV